MGPCAHHRIIAIINNGNDIKHLILDSFVYFFWALAVVTRFAPIRFYRQTTLRTEAFAQSSFYAQIFLHRGLCTKKNFCTQAPLEAFTHKKHVQKMFYRQTVFTQKVLRTEILRTDFFITHSICEYFLHTDAFTHRCLYTDTNCTKKVVHTARVYTQPTFAQRGFASPSCSPTFRVPPLKSFFLSFLWLFPPLLLHLSMLSKVWPLNSLR